MKKLVLLLVAALAVSLTAEGLFAQTMRERMQERQQERQERRGNAPVAAETETAAAPTADACDGTITVYRRTVCGEYRPVSTICAVNQETPVSECYENEYIVVRRGINRYQWRLVPSDKIRAE